MVTKRWDRPTFGAQPRAEAADVKAYVSKLRICSLDLMPMRARFAIAGGTAVALEALAGLVGVLEMGPTRVSLYLLACAVASAAATVALWMLLTPKPGGWDEEPGGGRDGDGDPPWWPEFERDLREHARERVPSRP